jgi:hypothetical protein
MILTQQKDVPWRWVFLVVMPMFVVMFSEWISHSALLFSIRKFIDQPWQIGLLLNLNILFGLTIGAASHFISDRIWTRFGRRKPLLMIGWSVKAACLFAIPLAPNIYVFVAVLVLWQIAADIATTYEPLWQEVVPPNKRGRAGGIFQVMVWCLIIFYNSILIGRFDDEQFMGVFHVTGEQAIYWASGTFLLVLLIFVALYFKEVKPLKRERLEDLKLPRFSQHRALQVALTPVGVLVVFFRGIFGQRDLLPVFLLVFSQTFLIAGLMGLDPLLITEQWEYSKQQFGTNVLVGALINLPVALALGFILDKVDRLKFYVFGILASFVMYLFHYCFVELYLGYGNRPSILYLIVFGQMASMVALVSQSVTLPLMYDYVPRDKMGTFNAGRNIVTQSTRFLASNGMFFFVEYYSRLRYPAPGNEGAGWLERLTLEPQYLPHCKYNYFSAYIFMLCLNVVGLAITAYFIYSVKKGKIVPLGREGFEGTPSAVGKEGQ